MLNDDLNSFSSLAEAVGLTQDGELQSGWFEDPIGTPNGSTRGLNSLMYTLKSSPFLARSFKTSTGFHLQRADIMRTGECKSKNLLVPLLNR